MSSEEKDFRRLMNVDNRENQRKLHEYISDTKSRDLSVQMQAVKIFMPHFSPQHNPQADRLFVKYFPDELLDQFHAMLYCKGHVDIFGEKKILFVDVFTFIFRNTNLLKYRKSESMAMHFLKFICRYANQHEFNLEDILDSIEVCILHKPNHILFIEKNGMLYFYRCFRNKIHEYESKFLEICIKVYKLDNRMNSSLNRLNLNSSLKGIIWEYNQIYDKAIAKLFFIVSVMLHRLGLLDDTQFSIQDLARITSSVLREYKQNNKENLYLLHASKIWSVIISVPCNRFIIDTMQKLECVGCVFAIYISNKLKKAVDGSGRFEVSKNTKQMLYIIHLTLVSEIPQHPLFSNKKFFKNLHTSIQQFFEEDLFEDHTIEHQFLLLQLYLKCKITINGPFSPHDEQVFYLLLDRFAKYPSLKINSAFLMSHMIFLFSVQWTSEESNLPSNLERIKRFIRDVILALSDDSYIKKLQSEQKLLLYEDLKDIHLSMISSAYIEDVFTRCHRIIHNQCKYESFDGYGNEGYAFYQKALTKTVLSFYESIFFDSNTGDGYLYMLENYSNSSSNIPSYPDNCGNEPGPTSDSQTIYLGKLSIPAILRWFILMFEMKFLFGDIYIRNSQTYTFRDLPRFKIF
ncbi:hypothetical protein RF11_05244 [Thelohanellus kitauei]|uniref:Uncharacterized protein n=1 Tax=Thelohanellus kitauei TaxID=669202 RepID=A0A0C2J0J7_THEKT|nr:hypothetical protein RF11_05244 [Thelohanellus kitauei]